MNAPPRPSPEASEPTREALLAALAERDRELAEARARQAATAEILRIISESPTDPQPVFDSIVLTAVRLLHCSLAAVQLCDGGYFSSLAAATQAGIYTPRFVNTPIDPSANFPSRAIISKEKLHLPDWSRIDLPEHERGVREMLGVNAALYLPLLRKGECFGLLTLVGQRPDMFGESEIAMAESFRDQAVIAIENAQLFKETQEALERQTATAEVLRVIAGSPSDVQPVFEAIATNANRLVGGLTTAVWRFANDEGHLAAFTPTNPAADAALKAMSPLPFARLPLFARVLDGEAAAIVDTETDTTPALRDFARLRGYRSMLFTPLMSQGAAIGAFSVTRKEPGSFAPHHIQLLRTFADQAVIAIQNTRLFNETQEALQQQTATADVLKVISRSAFDLQTVLETLIHSAVELCAANRGAVFLRDGDVFRWRAATGSGDEYAAYMRAHPQSGGRGSTVGRVILSGKVECISDVLDDPEFMLPANALVKTRATLGAPLLRDGKVEGVLVLTRYSPGPFTQRQIELVETFADQAVIAIENVRLFDEVQARTRDLSEALQQQTATADVLKVISRSAFDLDAVLNTLTGTAIQLCEATRGVIWLRKGEHLRLAAHVNYPEEWVKTASELEITPAANSTTASGIAAFTGEVVNVEDMLTDPRFSGFAGHRLGDYRGALAVPMDRDGEVVGVIALSRPEARRFTDRQVALVKAFADQAVIAINNVGLFNETQEALKQQTATADVLKVISRSAFDLQAVFDTLLGSAVALSGADSGVLAVRDGEAFRCRSFVNKSPDLVRFLTENPITPGPGSVMGRVALSGRIESIEDTLADSALAMQNVIRRTNDDRALVGVPLLREGRIEGAIVLGRREPGRFSDRSIELTQTFADQAVIAIENVRLFDEVQARTRDLSEALQQQTATADVLKAISRTAFDLDTVLETLISTAVRLCNASHGQIFRRHGDVYRYAASQMLVDPMYLRHEQTAEIKPGRGTLIGRVALENRTVAIVDAWNDPEYSEKAEARTGNVRAMLGVPLMRGGEPIGAFALARSAPVPFTQRQVELVTTFADQAVIAIENVRLFDEVQARTRDLSEALQQQTATADVLKVISRSVFDLDIVLQTLIDTAVRLTHGSRGTIFIKQGDVLVARAFHRNVPDSLRAYLASTNWSLDGDSHMARAAREGTVVHISDLSQSDRESDEETRKRAAFGAGLWAPLMRDGQAIGVFGVPREEPIAFSDREIELVKTFADQAVIAIENARLFEQVQAKTRDLTEALDRQTATSEILRVISQSPTDAQPVFDSIVRTAARLLHCDLAFVMLTDGESWWSVAIASAEGLLPSLLSGKRQPVDPAENFPARAILDKAILHLPDYSAIDLPENERRVQATFGINASLYLPLVREGECIGLLTLTSRRANAFGLSEIAQAESFRDQALIAMENARLFKEVKAKTDDLSESLQQQTATADVLKVISRSAFDLQAVFDTLIASAVELCGANRGAIFLRDGDVFRLRAASASSPDYFNYWRAHPAKAGRGSATARVILSGKIESIPDVLGDAEMEMPANTLIQIRATIGVPLLRDNQVEGVLVLTRPQPGVFTPRQVDLVQTFADQAVIAIENARLFNEVKARTDDLSEALRQQTATADVLKVISRSAFDLQAVLDTLVESAVSLIGAASGVIWLRDGDVFNVKAVSGAEDQQEFFSQLRKRPQKPGRHSIGARVLLTGEVQIVSDIKADPEYDFIIKAATNARTLLGVPLLRDGVIIGAFVLALHELGTFTPRQIELVQTFADQAVIAIENVRLFEEVQARTRDLSEALQQQTATADVLKVISRSAFDLDTVLQTLVESAARLCNAPQGVIHLREGDIVKAKAMVGHSAELMQRLRDTPRRAGRESIVPRVMLSGRVEHIADVLDDPEFDLGGMDRNRLGFRALLGVPLLRERKVEGVFVITSPHPGRFTDRQTELVQTFADQAVIAIENVRLFNEVQSKTDDLSEALQQQTATADVLKVISRSAFNLQAVLDTLVESAYRLSGAAYGLIYLRTGEDFECKAIGGMGAEEGDVLFKGRPIRAGRGTAAERVISTGEIQSIPDLFEDPEFDPKIKAAILGAVDPAFASLRSLIAVPMKRDDTVVGVIVIARSQTGLLPARQLELLQTFADQAVIAIENVRLFDEVQARTRDLSEALQQQTATADVLKVISRSAFGLKTVLQTLVDSAVRLCASDGVIYLRHGDVFRAEAAFGANIAGHDARNRSPRRAGRDSVTGRVALSGRVEQIPDNRADSEFKVAPGQRMNMRALLGVPLLRDGEVEGVFVLGKPEPGLFSDRAVELVRTFADQAVIAIQNVRLFDAVQAKTKDLEELLQLQTATSDVLKVISRSAFDLQAVFDTLIASAVELCAAFSGSICVRDGDVFRYTGSAGAGNTVALHNYLEQHPATPGRASMVGRVLLSGKVERIRDRLEDEEYAVPTAAFGNISRAFLGVPLLGKGGIEGALVLTREEPGYFTDRQIEIVQTFADQAVIAIENVRLFDEVQARTRELAASLDDLRKTQDRLIQSEKLASLGQLTAGIAHEIKNPLNFVNNFSALSRELIDELAELLEKAPLQTDQRDEASELIGMVSANLEKVVQHGKRADSIVKNMLLHSREGSGERSSVKVNAMVEEALNLAYHGARAEKPGFNVTIVKSLAPDAGAADLYAQEMTRVLLNLISNGFYATTKRRQGESNGAYEPTITASTRDLGHSVEIAIRDNGTGIPEEVKAKMFNPFFTTKPAGEGTGLGLSLSHDIVVKQHGGTLEVSTEPGAYTQFTIVLPRESKVRDEK